MGSRCDSPGPRSRSRCSAWRVSLRLRRRHSASTPRGARKAATRQTSGIHCRKITVMEWLLRLLGERLAKYLSTPLPQHARAATSPPEKLAGALEPGDVLLVEGHTRVSGAIKYLTQSTWSHSALYVGDALGATDEQMRAGEEPKVLIEADLRQGVHAVALSHFAGLHTRICRPVGLAPEDLRKVIEFAVKSIGEAY